MATPLDRVQQLDLVARLKSAYPELPDAPTPDLIDHDRFAAYVKTPHDVGGEPDAPIEFGEQEARYGTTVQTELPERWLESA
ncbi:hypothetical protein MMARJ_09890 [Mycobacterium marseillense]|uniref:Uncharacterized protein n=1 Tax=Mycobacterium marseillense TaxID=701042 RepID=A0ABM7J8R7_9MYCO|nr:hypothetical protein MMARJ_09890 [Mycobacterium marseillense]